MRHTMTVAAAGAAAIALLLGAIANDADVKIVQARLRHGSAKTTLDTHGHQWPDRNESTMAIVDSVFKARFEGPADSSRTAGGAPRRAPGSAA